MIHQLKQLRQVEKKIEITENVTDISEIIQGYKSMYVEKIENNTIDNPRLFLFTNNTSAPKIDDIIEFRKNSYDLVERSEIHTVIPEGWKMPIVINIILGRIDDVTGR